MPVRLPREPWNNSTRVPDGLMRVAERPLAGMMAPLYVTSSLTLTSSASAASPDAATVDVTRVAGPPTVGDAIGLGTSAELNVCAAVLSIAPLPLRSR